MKKTAKPKLAMKKAVAKPAMKGPSKTSNLKSYKFMPSKEYVAKKASPAKAPVKAASKPTTKVAAKPMKRLKLPEVTVTATKIKKAAPAAPAQATKVKDVKIQQERVRLYPKGEVNKKSVDSLRNIYGERVIPKEINMGQGVVPLMGPDASDRVKRLMKKSK
jgi:hypothetical protein